MRGRHRVGDRILLITTVPVRRGAVEMGAVVTLQDETQILTMGRQLESVTAMAQALRTQRHEFANRLHTVLGLVGTGAGEEAGDYLRRILRSGPIAAPVEGIEALEDPYLRALLEAKGTLSAEAGVLLRVSRESLVLSPLAEPEDVTMILGNLIDNAVRAVVDAPRSTTAAEDLPEQLQGTVEVHLLSAGGSGPPRDRRRLGPGPGRGGGHRHPVRRRGHRPPGGTGTRPRRPRGRSTGAGRGPRPRHRPGPVPPGRPAPRRGAVGRRRPRRRARRSRLRAAAAGRAASVAGRVREPIDQHRRAAMIDVLVLDDDVYVGRLHCRYVEQTPGFRALEPVRDLRSARKVLAAGGVDLLLADEVLPDGTGTQLIRETSVDAALLTAVTDAQVVRAALSAGALTCLFKPFDPEQLTSLLRRYARLRRVWEQERLSQAGLDRALRGFYDAGGAGASPESRAGGTSARILEALQRAQGPLPAVQVGEAIGVSRATAQRHLVRLAEQDMVTVSLRYGSAGRPEHLYAAPA